MDKGSGAKSFENFQRYIDGVEKFRRYKDRRIKQDFVDAETYLSKAVEDNPQYTKAHYYLGTLYRWRADYQQANKQLAEEVKEEEVKMYEHKAQETYNMLTLHYSPDVQALGHFGLGLLSYRNYQREKRMSPGMDPTASPSHPTLREANQHFKQAMQRAPELYFARAGHALVYKAMGCNRRSIKEFQRARQSVEDQASTAWIDGQIQALNNTLNKQERRAKQAIQSTRDRESRWSRLLAAFSWSSDRKGCS
jgi:tetratricopeptide (TPR) repeat protein